MTALAAAWVAFVVQTDPLGTPYALARGRCGVYALFLVLHAHGIDVPLTELDADVGLSECGTTFSSLLSASERHGVRGRAVECNLESLRRHAGLAILHLKSNHFVVLVQLDSSCAVVVDAPHDPELWELARLRQDWTGRAILFDRPAAVPSIHLDARSMEIDRLRPGDTASVPIAVGNTGDAPLWITSCRVQCDCAKPELPSSAIPPGGTAVVNVSIRAAQVDTGPYSKLAKDVVIGSNDPAQPEIHVVIRAEVRPDYSPEPSLIEFTCVDGCSESLVRRVRLRRNWGTVPRLLDAACDLDFVESSLGDGETPELIVRVDCARLSTPEARSKITIQTDSPERPIEIPIWIARTPAFTVVPPELLFASNGPDSRREVVLRRAGGATRIIRAAAVGVPCEIQYSKESLTEHRLTISVADRMRDVARGEVLIETDAGAVRVPVTTVGYPTSR